MIFLLQDPGARQPEQRIVSEAVGGVRDFGPEEGRVRAFVKKAGQQGSGEELFECLSNIRDGWGRYHHSPRNSGMRGVSASLDVLEDLEKAGKLGDAIFFIKEFPEMMKPSPNEFPEDLTIIQAVGDAVMDKGWSRENYERLARSYRGFCKAYRLDGLDPKLRLRYGGGEMARQDMGSVFANMGYSRGFRELFEKRNRIFPHEIGHFIADHETGILDVEDTPSKMLEEWGRVFREGVSTRHLLVPRVDFRQFEDDAVFDPAWMYRNGREVLADRIAMELGSRYVDREGLGVSVDRSNMEVYLRAYTTHVSDLPGVIRRDFMQLGVDVDNNHLIRPCAHSAMMKVNAQTSRSLGMEDLAAESERLSNEFRETLGESIILRSYGRGLYDRLEPIMGRLYADTRYAP
ncbi:MAG: hypothetical protein ABIH11_05830 [Candidatus Altiarchaeota archaeon]